MSTHRHILCLPLLTVFALVLYQQVFVYDTFGPEFPLFYFYNDGVSFTGMAKAYTYNAMAWYRPTAHALAYWVGDQFLDWHDLTGWKVYHFTTVLAAAFAIHWMVAVPLGFGALAGALSAGFFLAQPSIFAFVMEMSGFDFLYIFFGVLCAGFYVRAHRKQASLSLAIAWVAFLVSLTCKEVMLIMPFYLAVVSGAFVWLERVRLRTEVPRLLPFFALIPVYYFFHLAKIPRENFGGPYRLTPDWPVIAANLKNLTFWTLRFYAFTGDADRPMYQSNWLNNLAGLAILAIVATVWIRGVRRNREWRLPGVLLAVWIPAFLAIPVYAGGFLWHVNLAIAGYSALVGIALASVLRGKRLAIAAAGAGALLLARENLAVELTRGTHATGFRINGSLLTHPPLPSDRIPPASLIYIEDRLRMGPWWYGCFGKLFNYVYLRHDLEEVIVPPLAEIPADLKQKWAAHPSAFFFRYDSAFRWRDASGDLLAPGPARRPPCDVRARRLRINAGGTKIGESWAADAYFDEGDVYTTEQRIRGTGEPEVYRSERFHNGPFEYRFCVEEGLYRVTLRFAEIWFGEAGKRSFGVTINGVRVLSDFDVFKAAGGSHRAVDRVFEARAADGEIRIRFEPAVSNPKVNAIELERLD